MRLDTKHEAATHLVEAAQVMKKEDPHGTRLGTYRTRMCSFVKVIVPVSLFLAEAVACYQNAIEIYTDMVG